MILTRLRNNQVQLIKYMEEGGYSQSYISRIKNEMEKLFANENKYNNYLDYYENYIKPNTTLKNLRHRRGLLNIITSFDLYNEFPTRNRQKHKVVDNSKYNRLNSFFKDVIAICAKEASKRDKKVTTIHNELLNAINLLFYLQNIGYNDLRNVKESDVINFFLDENGNLKFSHSYAKNIKSALREAIGYVDGCAKIVEYLPKIKSSRKNIDFLIADEVSKIESILNGDNENFNFRDKAIISILLYTGMRGCDVANLKLSNIDWEKEIISLVQQKTGFPLEIPLTTSVGNALYNYITKERPKTKLDNIFIRLDADYPITKSTVNIATQKLFKIANIRQDDGKRKGTHIFRYNAAMSLLKNEIPVPIISQILGHLSPNSLNPYLNADTYHLKKCALSIKQFENIKGVK